MVKADGYLKISHIIRTFFRGYLFTNDSVDRQVDHRIDRLIWILGCRQLAFANAGA